jgi:hypothetical protein
MNREREQSSKPDILGRQINVSGKIELFNMSSCRDLTANV